MEANSGDVSISHVAGMFKGKIKESPEMRHVRYIDWTAKTTTEPNYCIRPLLVINSPCFYPAWSPWKTTHWGHATGNRGLTAYTRGQLHLWPFYMLIIEAFTHIYKILKFLEKSCISMYLGLYVSIALVFLALLAWLPAACWPRYDTYTDHQQS